MAIIGFTGDNDQSLEKSSQVPELTINQMLKIFGDSGTQRYSGYFLEEPNTLWRDEKRVDTVEEMRRMDASIKAVLNAIKAPVLATEWFIECDDEKIKEFVHENIFNGMDRTWKDFLREALAYLDFGHYVFEIIYKKGDDGHIYLKDLSPRIPRSILRWRIAKNEPGITQLIRTSDNNISSAEIPLSKLLVLTNDKEGDDMSGQSILRPAYKHYKFKDTLYRIQGIAAERYGVGVPVVTLPGNYGTAEQDQAEEMVKNLRSNEKSYIVLPSPEWNLRILTPEGNPQGQSVVDAIQHHNKMILMSVLANFLGLGTDGSGSFALSENQSSFFLKHVEDKALYVAEQITEQVIWRLVKLNFGEDAECPRLSFAPLGDIDFKEMSETLAVLSQAGLLDESSIEIKKFVRKTFKLPEMTQDEIDEHDNEKEKMENDIEKEKQIDDENKKNNVKDEEDKKELQEMINKKKICTCKTDETVLELEQKQFKPWRELTEVEKLANTDFEFLNEQFDYIEEELNKKMVSNIGNEIKKFVKYLLGIGNINEINDLKIGGGSNLKKDISQAINEAYEAGKTSASNELGVPRVGTSYEQKLISRIASEDMAEGILSEIDKSGKSVAKNALLAGANKESIAQITKEVMDDKAAYLIANNSGSLVGESVNRGRYDVFNKNSAKISKYQRSEILDTQTCNFCVSIDRRVVNANDPLVSLNLLHNNCRGIWIAVLGDDPQPAVTGFPKTVMDNLDLVDGKPIINRFKQLKKPLLPYKKEDKQAILDALGKS